MADPPIHFFKFIPPGLKFDLSIPKSFLTNLNHGRCSKVTLRRGCRKWSVDIDDGVLGDGWRRFARDNGVQEYDFIMFKHQGSMMFDFFVFDQSTCEREYPNLLDEMDVEEPPRKSNTIGTHSFLITGLYMLFGNTKWLIFGVGVSIFVYTKWLLKGRKKLKKRKRNDYAAQDQENLQEKKETGSIRKKATSSNLNNHPYFISYLKPCSFKSGVLYLPTHFTRPNGIKTGEMILIDGKGRSWKVQMNKKNENCLYIGRGFKAFGVANGLKEGDACKFELVENEKNKPPVVNFSCSFCVGGLIHSEEDGRQYFIRELKSYNLRKSNMYLPLRFAEWNGLTNKKKVILKNAEDERLWTVDLKNYKGGCYLGPGWKEFRVANGLKEGDCFKLEVVDKGEKPIVNFYLGKE